MALQLQVQGRFGYRRVQLDKKKVYSLGIGSYGTVYKAKCDQLLCAAKILHPILFETGDPAAQRVVQRFEQECQFLSEMRHPNVIQYLGTCQDPDSGLPVLLMELMDENLTSFLERSDMPLPFHIQVNIAHDIAQALAYLHSHDVIHRDLSSNNVLLIGNARAKVTDFGMSKLNDAGQLATPCPLTHLPGTDAYMPPEAFMEPPEYTNKLDCFSLGVLGIQIITQLFPKPGPRRKQVNIPKTQNFPTGKAEVFIPEVDRRNAHIALIDITHQLLLVSLDCLKDDDKYRPTAEDLSSRLYNLKKCQRYQESVEHAQTSATLEKKVHQLQKELETSEQLVADLQKIMKEKDKIIREQDETLKATIRESHNALRVKDETTVARDDALRAMDKALTQEEEALHPKVRKPSVLQQSMAGQESTSVGDSVKLCWEDGPRSPSKTYGESTAVQGKMAYFCDGVRRTNVFQYNSETGEWSTLECPKMCFSVAVVNELLTAIGGEQSGKATKTLLSLTDKQKWTEIYPPMTYHHNDPAVVRTNKFLIVAGGWGPDKERAPVEVMDITSLCWFITPSLPHLWHQASATICGDRIYIAGGFGEGSTATLSVRTCVLSDLLQSAVVRRHSLGAWLTSLRVRPSTEDVWQDVAELPVHFSTLVAFQGQLLAVGGRDSDMQSTSAVHQYDRATNSWKVISHMNTKRKQPMAVVLPGSRLMVVGGNFGITSVEVATLA